MNRQKLTDLVNDIQIDALEPGGSYVFVEEWVDRIVGLFAADCTGSGTCDSPIHIHGCYKRHRADQCDSPEEYGHMTEDEES